MQIGQTDLKAKYTMISMEATGAKKSGALAPTNRLVGFVKDFSVGVHETLGSVVGPYIPVGLTSRNIKNVLKDTKYMDVMHVELPTPVGMVGSYADTLKVLEVFDEELLDIEDRLLSPLGELVGILINNPEERTKLFNNNDARTADVDKLKKLLSEVHDPNDTSSSAKYSTLVQRQSDWDDVVSRLNTLNESYGKLDMKLVRGSVDELSANLKILANRLGEDKSANGSMLKGLVELVFSAAEEVELLSIYAFRLSVVTKAVEDDMSRLREIIR
jgi:hypothetical protein